MKKKESDWHYYSDRTFRTRFPVWAWDDHYRCWYLIVECQEFIAGRWEAFISLPDVWVEEAK